MRTLASTPSAHERSRSSRWMAMAVSSAAPGLSNTAKNSSARVSTAWPANADRGLPEQRAHIADQLAVVLAQPIDEAR